MDEESDLEAAAWFARVRAGELSEGESRRFEAWLSAMPGNRDRFQAMERAWSATAVAAGDEDVRAMRAAALSAGGHTVRPWQWVAAAAAVLFVAGAAVMLSSGTPLRNRVQGVLAPVERPHLYSTAVGERSTITLEDGSTLALNTETQLRVEYGAASRTITLLAGQALFEVAKDPRRPFIVNAGGRRIVAVGTSFDVRVDRDAMRITLIEGRVNVEEPTPVESGNPAAGTRRRAKLEAGQQLVAALGSPGEDRIRSANVEKVTSWREGRAMFENEALSAAVAEMNRYSARKIQVLDPTLGELRISGTFVTGNPVNFVKALGEYFPVDVKDEGPAGDLTLQWRK